MDSAQNAAVHQLIEDAEIARLTVGELAFSQSSRMFRGQVAMLEPKSTRLISVLNSRTAAT
jgi:hypothetical protein